MDDKEMMTRIAEFQYKGRNWRHDFGSGFVPGEEGSAHATVTVMPGYKNPEVFANVVMTTLDWAQRVSYANILYQIVNGHPVTEEDDGMPVKGEPSQKMEAFLQVIGKKK
jgi:hypothetical protein